MNIKIFEKIIKNNFKKITKDIQYFPLFERFETGHYPNYVKDYIVNGIEFHLGNYERNYTDFMSTISVWKNDLYLAIYIEYDIDRGYIITLAVRNGNIVGHCYLNYFYGNIENLTKEKLVNFLSFMNNTINGGK